MNSSNSPRHGGQAGQWGITERPIDRLLRTLEIVKPQTIKKTGAGFTALCPAHEDGNRSLSIREGDDGRVLIHCFAGCTVASVVFALGLEMRDLFANGRGGAR